MKPTELETALQTHTFDHLTDFCCHCGQSLTHVHETKIRCFGGAGIVAISHLRRGDILDAEFRAQGINPAAVGRVITGPEFTFEQRARLGITDEDMVRMAGMVEVDHPDPALKALLQTPAPWEPPKGAA